MLSSQEQRTLLVLPPHTRLSSAVHRPSCSASFSTSRARASAHPAQRSSNAQPAAGVTEAAPTMAGDGALDSKAARLLQDDDSECTHLVKVIFVGEAGVGKTAMLERLSSNRFEAHTQPTIGTDFKYKRYLIDGKTVGVTLWDTAGSERYAAMTASYYRGAHGVVLVFDVTRRETLQALERRWFPDLEHHVHAPDVIKLVIGNKTDLEAERQVTPEEGARVARDHGCMYKETSAARMDEDTVHDALVWGLLSNVMDSPALLKGGFGHEKLNVEQPPPPAQHRGGWPCCAV